MENNYFNYDYFRKSDDFLDLQDYLLTGLVKYNCYSNEMLEIKKSIIINALNIDDIKALKNLDDLVLSLRIKLS